LQRLLEVVTGNGHQAADIALEPISEHQRAAELHLRHHLAGEGSEHVALFRREHARLVVEYTDRAERQTVGRAQQCAGIETHMRLACHQRIAVEASILGDVLDFEKTVLENRVGADRLLHRRLAHAKPDFRLEPLPAIVNQTDDRDRCLADIAGDLGNVVERGLGACIENAVGPQRLQPFGFVRMQRCDLGLV